MSVIWIVLFLAALLILMIVYNRPVWEGLGKNVYSNFLLLSITPVVCTIGAHYRRLAYWGYDVLRPVEKKQYMQQLGFILLSGILGCWSLVALCFAIVPNIIFSPGIFLTVKFWLYLALTLNFAFIVSICLTLWSCIRSQLVVISQGAAVGVFALYCFYFVSEFSILEALSNNLILMASNIVLCRKAYEAWCENEFDVN